MIYNHFQMKLTYFIPCTQQNVQVVTTARVALALKIPIFHEKIVTCLIGFALVKTF